MLRVMFPVFEREQKCPDPCLGKENPFEGITESRLGITKPVLVNSF